MQQYYQNIGLMRQLTLRHLMENHQNTAVASGAVPAETSYRKPSLVLTDMKIR